MAIELTTATELQKSNIRNSLGAASSTNVQVFTSSGTWTKPAGAKKSKSNLSAAAVVVGRDVKRLFLF
jgi:hypothetical protein